MIAGSSTGQEAKLFEYFNILSMLKVAPWFADQNNQKKTTIICYYVIFSLSRIRSCLSQPVGRIQRLPGTEEEDQ